MDIIYFMAGVLIGIALSVLIEAGNFVGFLRVDQSDPTDKPYMFLELNKGVNDIYNRKNVRLKVKKENYIARK